MTLAAENRTRIQFWQSRKIISHSGRLADTRSILTFSVAILCSSPIVPLSCVRNTCLLQNSTHRQELPFPSLLHGWLALLLHETQIGSLSLLLGTALSFLVQFSKTSFCASKLLPTFFHCNCKIDLLTLQPVNFCCCNAVPSIYWPRDPTNIQDLNRLLWHRLTVQRIEMGFQKHSQQHSLLWSYYCYYLIASFANGFLNKLSHPPAEMLCSAFKAFSWGQSFVHQITHKTAKGHFLKSNFSSRKDGFTLQHRIWSKHLLQQSCECCNLDTSSHQAWNLGALSARAANGTRVK